MPSDPGWTHEKEYAHLAHLILLHTLELFFLLLLNWGLDKAIKYFEPHGFEAVVFYSVQVVFGLATIGSTLIVVIKHLCVLLIKAKKDIDASR